MSKRTKIIATIGPASESEEVLSQMIEAGMNLVRINFSHGTHESNGALIDMVKKIREDKGLPIGIIADLQGPRIRTVVDADLDIKTGDYIILSDLSLSSNSEFPIPNFQTISNDQNILKLDKEDIVDCLEIGNEILIEDGRIRLKAVEKNEGCVLAEVTNGGTVKNHKGVNIPDSRLNLGAMTEKDDADLGFALSKEVDFIALSFVGDAKDILDLKEKIRKITGKEEGLPKIIAKIERREAIKNIDEIIQATHAVMVARGDLGIEMPESKVVILQKEIITKCLAQNKPVIVATQMLETMIENPLPTRAEVSDVSNAVIDHTDCVMLSGESANGKYPVGAVSTMTQIIHDTEESPFDDNIRRYFDHSDLDEYRAIIDGAHELAKSSKAKAILMFSFWGNTPLMMSQHRPSQLMLSATNNPSTHNQSSIFWGVESYLMGEGDDIDDFVDFLIERGKQTGALTTGDRAVVIMGKLPDGRKMRMIGIKEVN